MSKKKEKLSYEDLERRLDHHERISKAGLLSLVMLVDRIGNLQHELNECVLKIQDAAMEREQLGKHAPQKTDDEKFSDLRKQIASHMPVGAVFKHQTKKKKAKK